MSRNGYPHMVLDHTVEQVRQIRRARRQRLDAIHTPDQARAYQQHIRAAINRAFAPRPPKTPLNVRRTGTVELPDLPGTHPVVVENLTFESRPGCLVTANLYRPADLDAPAPCVLGACGHSAAGKAADLYQGFSQRLARAGFVVLTYDPFSQGERDVYYGSGVREQVGWGTRAHNMIGKQLQLSDEFFGFWRAWDGIRALDVLLDRPEVDPAHVGLTGNSGGGTMSTWLWAIEDRFTMAAPGCFVTTFMNNLENELPADAEQCPPGIIGAGLEMADFIIANAPKPVLLIGQQHDFFDRRGLHEAYGDIQSVYQVMEAADDATRLFIGPQGHGYSLHNQKAMVLFFSQHAGIREIQLDEVPLLAPEKLWATPTGQVNEAGATPAYELSAARAQKVVAERVTPDAQALRVRLNQALTLPQRTSIAHYRVLRPLPIHRQGSAPYAARYAIETEGHIRALLYKTWPKDDKEQTFRYSLDVEPEVHLYLPHIAAEDDLNQHPWPQSMAAQTPLYALDVRGLGASLPEEQGDDHFFASYGMDYMLHAYHDMLGQSYLGRRVYDLHSTMDLFVANGTQAIHLYGRGQGALISLFAAVLFSLEKKVVALSLKNAPASLLAWTQTPLVTWPAACFVRGLLQVCDIDDCLAAVKRAGVPVTVSDPWGPTME